MTAKILIGIGILMIVLGIVPILREIYKMSTESAGIGAMGGIVLSVFFVLVGTILVGAGAIKFRRDKYSNKYL